MSPGRGGGHPVITRSRALAKLVLRTGPSLDSQKCGNIPEGATCLFMDQVVDENGNLRVKVGVDSSPRGAVVVPLGWVTAVKDGDNLMQQLDGSSEALKAASDSMASRIAKRRQSASRARTNTLLFRGAPSAAEGAGADSEAGVGGGPSKEEEAAAKKKKKEAARLLGSKELKQMAEAERSQAASEEASDSNTLKSRLGLYLIERSVKVNELVKEWDRNGDGSLSKPEFRISVRKLGMTETDVHEIDALYDELDDDNSGDLEVSEIKAALSKFKEEAKTVGGREAILHAHAKSLRKVAALHDTAAEHMAALESAEAELAQLRRPDIHAVDARLGALLIKRNIKVADMISKWDVSGNGEINPKEFKKGLKALGLEASEEEMDGLFEKFDTSGDGELGKDELQVCLKQLADAPNRYKIAEKEQKSEVARRKAAAKASQEAAAEAREQAESDYQSALLAAREEAEAKAQKEAEARGAKEALKRQEMAAAQERQMKTVGFAKGGT